MLVADIVLRRVLRTEANDFDFTRRPTDGIISASRRHRRPLVEQAKAKRWAAYFHQFF
jgi:hypothetical protein